MKHLMHKAVWASLLALLLPSLTMAAQIQSQSGIGSLQAAVTATFHVLLLFFPGIATVYLILTGYRYIIAQGNPDLVEKAKKSLTYAVFGVIVAYASVAFVLTVSNFLHFTP